MGGVLAELQAALSYYAVRPLGYAFKILRHAAGEVGQIAVKIGDKPPEQSGEHAQKQDNGYGYGGYAYKARFPLGLKKL